MKINNVFLNNKNNKLNDNKTSFKGGAMSPLSKALYTLSNNDMLNASFIDVFAMDTPRTIVEFNIVSYKDQEVKFYPHTFHLLSNKICTMEFFFFW